jgi:hypothetical protein
MFISRPNVVGFHHEAVVTKYLKIGSAISAITAVDLPDGILVILIVHEAIYNYTADLSLLSEFQLREFDGDFNSFCHKT